VRQPAGLGTTRGKNFVVGKQCLGLQALALGNKSITAVIRRAYALQNYCVEQFGVVDNCVTGQTKREIVGLKNSFSLARNCRISTHAQALSWRLTALSVRF